MVMLPCIPDIELDGGLRIERFDPLRPEPSGEVESDPPHPLPQRPVQELRAAFVIGKSAAGLLPSIL
jgi:hypothetical protein